VPDLVPCDHGTQFAVVPGERTVHDAESCTQSWEADALETGNLVYRPSFHKEKKEVCFPHSPKLIQHRLVNRTAHPTAYCGQHSEGVEQTKSMKCARDRRS